MNLVIFDPIKHKYSDQEGRVYPSVTQILNHFGMTPDFDQWGNETARNFGTVVHKVCELYDNGELSQYEYDRRVDPWLEGYKRFIDAFGPVWIAVERPMVSKAFGFAGTADRVCFMRDANTVLDIKTGAKHASHEIQTGGYEALVCENIGMKIKKRFSLYLMQNDFRLVEHKNRSDRSFFLGLANAYNWKMNHNLIGAEK